MGTVALVDFSDVLVGKCSNAQTLVATTSTCPSIVTTRSTLSGSGGGPMIRVHATPSAIAIQYLLLT